jgi:Tfp pilus assembly protein PilF
MGLAAAGILAATAAAAQQGTNAGGSVVLIDGMAVDLLDPKPGIRIAPPGLSVDMDSRAGRLVRRPLETPPPTAPERDQAQRHYARALEYIRQADPMKATLEIRDGLSFAPDEPRLLSLAAMVASQTRDLDAAANYFRRYLELDPSNLQHTAAFVAVLLRLSRMDEAERVLSSGEVLAPDFMPFRFHRACLQLSAERFQSSRTYWAQRPFDEFLAVAQWLHSDRVDLARIVGADGYERLVADILGPEAAAHVDRIRDALDAAAAARGAQDWAASARHLGEAAALGANGYGLRTAMAEALENRGDRNGAIEEWRRILAEHDRLAQAWVSFGHVLLRSARFDEALPVVRRAKELAPEEAVIDFLLASALALTGKIADAQALYADLVSRRPRDLRKWLESDAVFEAALDQLPNKTAILRRLDIPPELE